MDAAQGNHGNGGRRQRNVVARRSWNPEEEDVLLACLKELVATGWKSDNGFRSGYVYKLEEMMRVHFPATNIRANPHIISKLTGWKKNYGSLVYVLGRSGVGLNGDFTIDCDDGLWDQICNVDSNAKNIRGKAWPYYDGWTEVFGKDRATGAGAEDILEAVNELIAEDNVNVGENVRREAAINVNGIHFQFQHDTEDSDEPSARREMGSLPVPKKRKIADNVDKALCDMLGQMQRDTNYRLESIAHRIGYQSDMGQARKEVWALLDNIVDLDMDDKFDIADVLIENPQKLEFFSSLPVAARPAYVGRLLNGKGV